MMKCVRVMNLEYPESEKPKYSMTQFSDFSQMKIKYYKSTYRYVIYEQG